MRTKRPKGDHKLTCPKCKRHDYPYYEWRHPGGILTLRAYCVGCGKYIEDVPDPLPILPLAPDPPASAQKRPA